MAFVSPLIFFNQVGLLSYEIGLTKTIYNDHMI